MKTIRLLFVLIFSAAAAQAADREVKLLGVTSGLGIDVAAIEIRTSGRNSPEVVYLKAGQAMEGVEIININAGKGEVGLNVDGENRQLTMPTDWDYGSTNELDPTLPVMYFRAMPLQMAVSLYADYKKRTVLLHPKLGDPTVSLKVNPRTEAEAEAALEKLFSERNVATIPDGEHFVMVAPFAFTNSLAPRSSTLPQTNSVLPALSINFRTCPIDLVFQTYSDYVQKQIVNRQDRGVLNCCDVITLCQTTPLSKDEACYALETLIEWHNIRMTPDGDGNLKLERIAK